MHLSAEGKAPNRYCLSPKHMFDTAVKYIFITSSREGRDLCNFCKIIYSSLLATRVKLLILTRLSFYLILGIFFSPMCIRTLKNNVQLEPTHYLTARENFHRVFLRAPTLQSLMEDHWDFLRRSSSNSRLHIRTWIDGLSGLWWESEEDETLIGTAGQSF